MGPFAQVRTSKRRRDERPFLPRSGLSPTVCTPLAFSQLPWVSTMATKSQRPKGQDGTLSSLNVAINTLNLAKDASSIIPARAAFNSASTLLTVIRVGCLPVHVGRLLANSCVQDSMTKKRNYVELGLACANVCEVLGQGTDAKRASELSQPVFRAIERLTM